MSYANHSPPMPQRLLPDWKRRGKRWILGCYRLGVILAALACLRAQPRNVPQVAQEKILAEARLVLSAVTSIGTAEDGFYPLRDENGENIGWATTTFPQAESIQGYSGPSQLLVIFDEQRTVRAVAFLTSTDTAGHLEIIRDDRDFWQQWTGKSEASLGALGTPRIVTGASLTSEAMARGIAARFGAEGMDQWFRDPLTLEQIVGWFPAADHIAAHGKPGSYQILKGSEKLGTVLRSSRMGVSARGFNGTSDVLVALDASGGVILGISLLGSRDNEPYVGDVKDEVKYADGFAGKSVAHVLADNVSESPSLHTSGASVTTHAVVESVREMLRRHHAQETRLTFPWKATLALIWIAFGVLITFRKWRHQKQIRLAYAVISVVAGVTLGWLLSQDQLIGWGRNGVDVRTTLPLLVLTAVALMIPAFTGKNIYCSRICPHGAAQTLVGNVRKSRFALPPKLHAILIRVPWLTLLAIWALALIGSGLPLAYFEPFETWSTGFIAFVPAAIFTIGLIAAFFLPQAYCHYGCPTGAMLHFLTQAPGRWTMKDSLAGSLVIISALVVIFA